MDVRNNKLKVMKFTTTITIESLELDIEGWYTPGEPEVRYYRDGSGYPGSDPELEIYSVSINGNDISAIFERFDLWDKLEEIVYEQIQEDGQNAREEAEVWKYEHRNID
jgi:hypothetical protein